MNFVLLGILGIASTEGASVSWAPISLLQGGNAPLGRIPAASTVCGGSLIVFGGETDDDSPTDGGLPNRYLNDVWRFDPSPTDPNSGAWTQLTPTDAHNAPLPRVNSAMVCHGNVATLFGGLIRTGPGGRTTPASDIWAFDIVLREWSLRQEEGVAGGIGGHTAVSLGDGEAVLFGGLRGDGTVGNGTWMYDTVFGSWSGPVELTGGDDVPGARDFHTAVGVSPSVMRVWGGIDDGRMWTFSLPEERWSWTVSSLPYKSGRSGVVVVRAGSAPSIATFGGLDLRDGVRYWADVAVWVEGAADWSTALAVSSGLEPIGRCYAAIETLGNNVTYVYGGYAGDVGGSGRRLGDLWMFTLQIDDHKIKTEDGAVSTL